MKPKYEPKKIKDRFRGFLPVIVDIETSGFDPQKAAILQVAFMFVTMDEHGMLHPDELLRAEIRPFPGAQIEEANIKYIGLDPFDESRGLEDEFIALPRLFKAVSKRIRKEGCKKAILVGHNGAFDRDFINAAVERMKYKRNPFHPFTVLDTASLSGLVYGQTVLGLACFAAGIDFDDGMAHDAGYDTRMECELFCRLVNRFTLYAGFPPPLPRFAEQKLEEQRHRRTEEQEGETQISDFAEKLQQAVKQAEEQKAEEAAATQAAESTAADTAAAENSENK